MQIISIATNCYKVRQMNIQTDAWRHNMNRKTNRRVVKYYLSKCNQKSSKVWRWSPKIWKNSFEWDNIILEKKHVGLEGCVALPKWVKQKIPLVVRRKNPMTQWYMYSILVVVIKTKQIHMYTKVWTFKKLHCVFEVIRTQGSISGMNTKLNDFNSHCEWSNKA